MGERDTREVIRKLKQEGWDCLPGKGSHAVFRKEGRQNISVPTGKKELAKGTYDAIAGKAGWK